MLSILRGWICACAEYESLKKEAEIEDQKKAAIWDQVC
jgi:hypothetical protein